ncbi:hypothetical protein C2G38_2174930 [Gigaspora rosea]|uniref:Uncharacterized protein n=1 Tax=Gigaspora rosea TaxID=44941 RepID=A0A397VQ41_9GLOM|nr:hypothetical protein C2G38_2174930 [Gigaspora rosea]
MNMRLRHNEETGQLAFVAQRYGIEKDERKALHQKFAEMENTSGIYNLGHCYKYGIEI